MMKVMFVVFMMLLLVVSMQPRVHGQPQVPCLFIFGDSLSDSGNNNLLPSLAKSNFLPYGIDFPRGPTGRFTNGRTTIDLVGDLLGLEGYIGPFLEVQGEDILKGVNYASGSAGIREETGIQVGARISMDRQLENHQITISRIESMIGGDTMRNLNKCLYSVYVGSNDWMLNYYYPGSPTRLRFTPEAFADALIAQLSQQLMTLYNQGARKVVLFGMSPLGCLPLNNVFGKCNEHINQALDSYNTKLRALADEFNNKYADAKFIWINSLKIITPDLSGLGMRVKNIPCCGALSFGTCLPLSIPCIHRDEFVYWDNAHTTEAANRVLAARAYKAQAQDDAHPMDISRLATV